MFRQQAVQKLPTLLQWLKETESSDKSHVLGIDKILWGDKYRSITFFTLEYRVSIKFPTEEAYRDGVSQVMDALPSEKKALDAYLEYSGDSGEFEVILQEPTEATGAYRVKYRQYDWGIVLQQDLEEEKTPPATTKNPSAKLTTRKKSTRVEQ